MSTMIERTGTGTRDWIPAAGEFRPSSLGACPRYAWLSAQQPTDERPRESVGKLVQFAAGHAAEHEWIRLQNEQGATWTTDVDLDNGFGGTCHPDGLDYTNRVVAEIKFTNFKSPAAYHLWQIRYYMHRMEQLTGDTWSGIVVLLDKNGNDPQTFPVDALTPEMRAAVVAKAALHAGPIEPAGVCTSAAHSQAVKYYDAEASTKPLPPSKAIVCPFSSHCYPPPDDCEV